jgi:hypothetical protein
MKIDIKVDSKVGNFFFLVFYDNQFKIVNEIDDSSAKSKMQKNGIFIFNIFWSKSGYPCIF